MHLPLIQLLGLANGAIGIVEKAFAHVKSEGSFDAQLMAAMSGKTDAGNPVSQVLGKKGAIDDEALQSILATPSGVLLFQFMAALKEMGVQSSDIRLLLSGKGAQVSDDSMKALLSQLGMGQKDLDAILADPQKMSEIKVRLADSFKAVIDEQALKDGVDPDALLELAVSGSKSIDSVIELLEQTALSGRTPDADSADPAVTSSADKPAAARDLIDKNGSPAVEPVGPAVDPGIDEPAVITGLIQRNLSHATNEIRAALARIVNKAAVLNADQNAKEPAISGIEVSRAAEEQNPEAALKVTKAVSTAEGTLGISKDALRDLFFETDPAIRRQAVAQVTEKVGAYLKSHEGKPLAPEVKEALSFVKTAMSEQEFSGIDRSLKLWTEGQAISDMKFPVDREMYAALSKNLSGEGTNTVFENHMMQVIDQLRQSLPSSMKNGEGQVTLRLNPPMLGNVEVRMTMHDGELQAAFRTDQGITRDILLQNMSALKDALADQGIKVTQFSVSTTIDSRPHGSGFAFASHERQGQGFGHQERGPEYQGRSFREDEGTAYAQANYTGLLEGSLDFFA